MSSFFVDKNIVTIITVYSFSLPLLFAANRSCAKDSTYLLGGNVLQP